MSLISLLIKIIITLVLIKVIFRLLGINISPFCNIHRYQGNDSQNTDNNDYDRNKDTLLNYNKSRLLKFFDQYFHQKYDGHDAQAREQHYKDILHEYVDSKYTATINGVIYSLEQILQYRVNIQDQKFKSIHVEFQDIDCYATDNDIINIYTYHTSISIHKAATNDVDGDKSYGYASAKFTMRNGKIMNCIEVYI